MDIVAGLSFYETVFLHLLHIDINECGSTPCQHGSTCIEAVNLFSCECTPGYTGDFCETGL